MPPVLISSDARIEETLDRSRNYIEDHSAEYGTLGTRVRVFRNAQFLFPLQRWSSHGIADVPPLMAAYQEFESSYQQCLRGFYKSAIISLRCVLELGLLQTYFAFQDANSEKWAAGELDTPRTKEIVNGIFHYSRPSKFNKRFSWRDSIWQTINRLHPYVHSNGPAYTSQALWRTNGVMFSEDAIKLYNKLQGEVVRHVLVGVLLSDLEFPSGHAGLIEECQIDEIVAMLPEWEGRWFRDESARKNVGVS